MSPQAKLHFWRQAFMASLTGVASNPMVDRCQLAVDGAAFMADLAADEYEKRFVAAYGQGVYK